MSRKGNPYDNAVAASFFRALKSEWVNQHRYRNLKEAYKGLYYYLEIFYKYQRGHESLGYKTPAEFKKLRNPELLAV